MAHFYGWLQGSSGQTTRCGTKNSGERAEVQGWDLGCVVTMVHELGEDKVRISLTGGQRGGQYKYLGTFTEDDLEAKND